ncbi:MAG: HXXEE domain-containing protein [Planctomycetota bacterium]
MKHYLPLICLVLLFAGLWLPLGQHDFLIPHWMKVGTFLAPVLLLMWFSEGRNQSERVDFRGMSVVMLALYIAHQFEEHWFDVFGQYYAFYQSVNALLAGVLGQEAEGFEVLTPLSIFVINTSLVWLVGFTAIQFSATTRFPALAMNGIILVNAGTHLLAAIAKQAYNPGTLTSVILFIPFSIYFYRLVLITKSATRFEVLASLAWAVSAHVLMVGGLIAANWLHVFPEIYYLIALVVWSLVPACAFRMNGKHKKIETNP